MFKLTAILLFGVFVFKVQSLNPGAGHINKYEPVWDELDKRPLPEWYDRAKIGIFIHWGVFSVPSFGSEWFWVHWHSGNDKYVKFMNKNYPPGFKYPDFAPMFTAEFFDPDQWAALFKKSGAKYVVLTSKHHEGFTLFPSKRSFNWNAVDVGPHRDLVGDLAKAVRSEDLKFGLYHSLFEWFNPMYLDDKKGLFKTQTFVRDKLIPDLEQLVKDYEPSVIWADGDWEALDKYWNSQEFLAWLYNDSPVKDEVVVNDRWGIGTACTHGGYYNCADNFKPGKLQPHKWESAFTLDRKSWGYRRNLELKEILTIDELLQQVVETVSCGGNALINVGPTKDGMIPTIFEERLTQLGAWLDINGEAIYNTSPWTHQNDSFGHNSIWYTCIQKTYDHVNPTRAPKDMNEVDVIYAIFLKWPEDDMLRLKFITPLLVIRGDVVTVSLLGHENEPLQWNVSTNTTTIELPDKATVNGDNAWTIKFSFTEYKVNVI